jgi:hypothetical protein
MHRGIGKRTFAELAHSLQDQALRTASELA